MGGTGSMKRTKKINKIRRGKQQPFRATACVSCGACLGDRNGVRRGEKGVCSATGAGCISSRTNSSPLEVSRVLSWRQPSTLTPTSPSLSLSSFPRILRDYFIQSLPTRRLLSLLSRRNDLRYRGALVRATETRRVRLMESPSSVTKRRLPETGWRDTVSLCYHLEDNCETMDNEKIKVFFKYMLGQMIESRVRRRYSERHIAHLSQKWLKQVFQEKWNTICKIIKIICHLKYSDCITHQRQFPSNSHTFSKNQSLFH